MKRILFRFIIKIHRYDIKLNVKRTNDNMSIINVRCHILLRTVPKENHRGGILMGKLNQSHLVRVWSPRAQVLKLGDAGVCSLFAVPGACQTYWISELPFL